MLADQNSDCHPSIRTGECWIMVHGFKHTWLRSISVARIARVSNLFIASTNSPPFHTAIYTSTFSSPNHPPSSSISSYRHIPEDEAEEGRLLGSDEDPRCPSYYKPSRLPDPKRRSEPVKKMPKLCVSIFESVPSEQQKVGSGTVDRANKQRYTKTLNKTNTE